MSTDLTPGRGRAGPVGHSDVPALLQHLTTVEVGQRARSGATLLVPLGATEQHGPHLPVTVDAEVAGAVAERIARARRDVVVAPTLPFGASGEHQTFAGTLSIGQAATEQVLVELGRSAMGVFRRLVFVNAHGGNRDPLVRAVTRLRDEGRDVRAWAPSLPGDAHAGWTETSLMLQLRPTQVRGDRLEPGATAPLPDLMVDLCAHGVSHVAPNGVLGDPIGASAEDGRMLLEQAVAQLDAYLDAV